MASPYLLDAGPGQDKFSDLYSKYDSAVDEVIDGASLVGDNLILSKYNGTDFIVDLSPLAGGGLPPGTVEGQNMRWDDVGMDWVLAQSLITLIDIPDPSNNVTILSPRDGRSGSEAGFTRVEGGDVLLTTQPANGTNYSFLSMNGFEWLARQVSPAGTLEMHMYQSSGNIELLAQVPGGGVVVDALEGIEIKDNAPTVVADKLYNSGGNLYWGGSQVCLAPCGGGGTPYTIARSSVLAPGTFNVPVPGTEAERIVSLDPAIGGGAYIINLPTTGVNSNYRITVKRVDLSPLTHTIAIDPGTGTIDGLPGPVNMNFSRNESISFIARSGATFGTYDWQRDDNYIDTDALPTPYKVQNIKYTTAGPHTIVPNGNPNRIVVKVDAAVPVDINLPASPTNNLEVIVKATLNQVASINNIRVNGGPNTVDNMVFAALINYNMGSLTFIWNSDGIDSTWLIV